MNPSRPLHRSLALLLLLLTWSLALGAPSPTEQVRSTTDRVLALITDESRPIGERRREIRKILSENMDIQSISRSVLATRWKEATPEEKRGFVEFFQQYIENTYLDPIESYRDEEIEYTGEKVRGERAVVSTIIHRRDRPDLPVNYRLRLKQDRWYLYDVEIEGSSLINTYRTTFNEIVRADGMEGLLDDLRQRVERYKKREGHSPAAE